MTEGQMKKEEPAPVSELGKAPKGAKKSPMIAIVAIIVVIALIATAVVVLLYNVAPEGPSIVGWTSPSQISLDKGEKVRIVGYATFKNNSQDDGTNMSSNTADLVQLASWQGTSLGTLTRGLTENDEVSYVFESKNVGSSAIKWTFRYTDLNDTQYRMEKLINVTVGPATLSYVDINPASWVMLKEATVNFTAQAFMTDASSPSGITYAWSVDNAAIGSASPATGNETTFTAATVTEWTRGNLTCTAALSGDSIDGNVEILVLDELPEPSTISKFYDLFNVPFLDYWDYRNDTDWYTTSYPYLELWTGSPAGNTWLYGNNRMNITARNISKVNTLSIAGGQPWYMPTFSQKVKGGTIEIDWVGDYMTSAEVAAAPYPDNIKDWYDGWFWKWTGTTTMDKTAAKMVLDMTDADFGDFDNWKSTGWPTFKTKFSAWLASEADKWGLFYAYEYPYNGLSESYDIEKVGDKIVFHIEDQLSWGVETIWGRWWSYTFLPYEYWPEDVHFTGTITPLWSDFNLQMAMQYSFFAWNATKEGRPSFVFETVHADALPGGSAYYQSQINNYFNNPDTANQGYWCRIVGNAKYGKLNNYDYTPWYWNLGQNDKLIIEWPDRDDIDGYQHVGTGDYTHIVTGNVTPRWIEPLPSEMPDVVDIDLANNILTFSGPFDAYKWSKNTLNARELHENWSRINDPPMIPHGCPWVEFVVNTDVLQKPTATIGGMKMAGNNSVSTWNGSGSWDVDGTIASYAWEFGDGGTDTGPIGSHTYAAPYTPYEYILNLTVTDNNGLTSTDSMRITVVDNFPPVADFTAPKIGYTGTPIMFNASLSSDLDGNISLYEWDFGDGNAATGRIVNYTYTQFGAFTVTLTVTDNHPTLPLSDTDSMIISIINAPGTPLAKIYLPQKAIVGESVQLSGVMSSAVTGSVVSTYAWDFGDTQTGSGVTPTHTWTSTGTYTVTLVVTDNHSNNSSPDIRTIQVVPAGATGIGVTLDKHALKPGETTTMTVSVVDSTGDVITTFNGNVTIVSNVTGYNGPASLTLTNGVATTSVSFSNVDSYLITVTNATLAISGDEFASVAYRTVEYTIYDIFDYPLGDWWDQREWYYSRMDEPFRYTAPTVEIYRPGIFLTEAQATTTYRLNLEGENISEIRITNPTYFPRITGLTAANLYDPAAGNTGNASYHLTCKYLTKAGIDKAVTDGRITIGQKNAWDGWEYDMWGNLTMDRAAAAHLIGLPVSEPNVANWWTTWSWAVQEDWEIAFWENESSAFAGAPGRLDIRASDDGYSMFGGYWNSAFLGLTEDVSGNVTLSFWRIGYGEDILLMRQLYWGGESYGDVYPNGTPYGILPYECWLEDIDLLVNMSETSADVYLDCGVVYGFRAWKSDTAPPGTASWRWENIRADYMAVVPPVQLSEMDLYSSRSLTYTSWDSGSTAFGKEVAYDYTPNIWNMVLGEVLVIEKPTVMAVGYMSSPMIGNYSQLNPDLAGYYHSMYMLEKFGDATLHAVGAPVGTAIVDADTGDLKISGPFEPIKVMTPGYSWLLYEPAPRIEIWV